MQKTASPLTSSFCGATKRPRERQKAWRSIGTFASIGANTSIGVVATNLKLTRLQLKRVAMMAHDGLARAIRPVHTPHDGDLLFAVSTNQLGHDLPEALASMLVGNMAADAVESALLSLG